MKYSESKGKSHWFQGLFQFGNRVNNTEKEGVVYLVAKMPASCENHGNTLLVTGFNDLLVTPGAPRLDDCTNSCLRSCLNRIGKRKESIGCKYGSLGTFSGFLYCNFHRIDTAHLASPGSHQRVIATDGNRVGFNVAYNFP